MCVSCLYVRGNNAHASHICIASRICVQLRIQMCANTRTDVCQHAYRCVPSLTPTCNRDCRACCYAQNDCACSYAQQLLRKMIALVLMRKMTSDMTMSYPSIRHVAHMNVSCLTHLCHDPFTSAPWLIRRCDTTHWDVCHDSHELWVMARTCDTTHWDVCHDSHEPATEVEVPHQAKRSWDGVNCTLLADAVEVARYARIQLPYEEV